MKWPNYLALVRHGRSAFNKMKDEKHEHPLWKIFLHEYNRDYRSKKTRELAEKILRIFSLPYSDYDTPITELGRRQARKTGEFLKQIIQKPDVLITSPYIRCQETLKEVVSAWPELHDVPIYTEEYIRERNTGLATLYCDWRLFYAFHPEQKELFDLVKEYEYCYPQGESHTDVRTRGRLWLGTLTREFAEKNVLAFMHHVSIVATRANLERMSPEAYIELNDKNPPKNCSVTVYRGHPELGRDGKLILERYNSLPEEHNA
ncbi:MAG: histidine phosphatase family protein [Candidatus Sungbacteria bacterium]|nr:histidine phosphatase family protein [Candidatus Sungbacteria bacterium]